MRILIDLNIIICFKFFNVKSLFLKGFILEISKQIEFGEKKIEKDIRQFENGLTKLNQSIELMDEIISNERKKRENK